MTCFIYIGKITLESYLAQFHFLLVQAHAPIPPPIPPRSRPQSESQPTVRAPADSSLGPGEGVGRASVAASIAFDQSV